MVVHFLRSPAFFKFHLDCNSNSCFILMVYSHCVAQYGCFSISIYWGNKDSCSFFLFSQIQMPSKYINHSSGSPLHNILVTVEEQRTIFKRWQQKPFMKHWVFQQLQLMLYIANTFLLFQEVVKNTTVLSLIPLCNILFWQIASSFSLVAHSLPKNSTVARFWLTHVPCLLINLISFFIFLSTFSCIFKASPLSFFLTHYHFLMPSHSNIQ